MNGELMDRNRASVRVGTALWVIATLVGIPAGLALMMEIDPKIRWTGNVFPVVMFTLQTAALAIAGRGRPLLLLLGFALMLAAAFCWREMLPRSVSPWVRIAVYGLFFGVAWAGALARGGKQAVAWILLGTVAVVSGFWLGEQVYDALRQRIEARDTRRIVSMLGLALGIVVFTTPLVWAFLRQAGGAPRDLGRERVSAGTLTGGRLVLVIAGLYLVAIGGVALYGAVEQGGDTAAASGMDLFPRGRGNRADAYPHDALNLGALNFVLAGACLVVGVGLLARVNAARHAFQIVAPLGALAIASVFARTYWTEDLPETVFLGLPFGLLVFALGRRASIAAATLDRDERSAPPTAVARGLGWAIGLLAVAFVAYFSVKMNKPTRATHPALRSFADLLDARNEHVKHLAVTYLLLWHAIPALLAAAIPSGPGPERASR